MSKRMSATQARIHFGDVMRRVAESGEAIVVERAGSPQVAVVSMPDYERLLETRGGRIRPLNQAAIAWLDEWLQSYDPTETEWWEEFERDLRAHPIQLGE